VRSLSFSQSVGHDKLKTFYAKHSNTEQALRAWYDEAKKARWETP